MEKSQLKVEYVPISSVEEYENNAKVHTPAQIEQIKNSIDKFGMNDPIGVWHNTIVEGHGRLIACRELGLEEIPIIKLDHLTDKERKAYLIAHNKLTLNTPFDDDILGEEIKDLLDDFDMTDYGFDEEELNKLLGEDEIASGVGEINTTTSYNYSEQYGVIVICSGEAEQERVYNELVDQGYECKVVAV